MISLKAIVYLLKMGVKITNKFSSVQHLTKLLINFNHIIISLKSFLKIFLDCDQLLIVLIGKTLNQDKTLPLKVKGNNLQTTFFMNKI